LRRLERRRRVRALRAEMLGADPLNVSIGAGTFDPSGWFATDLYLLDITSPRDWRGLFEANSIDRLMAEHVLEHLTESECQAALGLCHGYLKPGGLFRIAVPDGYRTDDEYVAEVAPPNAGHQTLLNVDSLTALLEAAGFEATPLEYFDADGEFHATPWDESDGKVMRSLPLDRQDRFKREGMYYTSLIVDARKA